MIITNCGIQDITTEIIEPISEQIVRKIISILSLEDFFKENVYINSDYLTGSRTNDSELIPVLQNNRIDCDVTYVQDPSKNKWETSTTRHSIEFGNTKSDLFNLQTLFEDKDIKTNILEHTAPCTITINCVISCLERSNANSIFNTILNTIGPGEPTSLVDVSYSYLVPDPVIFLIGYVYKLSNVTDKTFKDYIKEKSKYIINYKMNKNINKQKYAYVINKTELELMVENTINDDKPQAVKNNKSTNHYTISFTLNCQFSKPNIIFMKYPIIIKNQLVDSSFLPDNILERKNIYDHTTHPYVAIKGALEEFELKYTDGVYKIPFYDNFIVPQTFLNMLGYIPFFSGATPINTEGDTSIDLSSNLGSEEFPIHIRQEVLDIINDKGIGALNGTLPITVSVFADDTMLTPSSLKLEGLTLSFSNKDISKIYRIIIFENTETSKHVQSLRVLKYVLFPCNPNTF